jgi:outer membrane protein assembly factor BamB
MKVRAYDLRSSQWQDLPDFTAASPGRGFLDLLPDGDRVWAMIGEWGEDYPQVVRYFCGPRRWEYVTPLSTAEYEMTDLAVAAGRLWCSSYDGDFWARDRETLHYLWPTLPGDQPENRSFGGPLVAEGDTLWGWADEKALARYDPAQGQFVEQHPLPAAMLPPKVVGAGLRASPLPEEEEAKVGAGLRASPLPEEETYLYVAALAVTPDTLWCGIDLEDEQGGLVACDRATGQWRALPDTLPFATSPVQALTWDGKRLWVVLSSPSVLVAYDPARQRAVGYLPPAGTEISALAVVDGQVWIGTSKGVWRMKRF